MGAYSKQVINFFETAFNCKPSDKRIPKGWKEYILKYTKENEYDVEGDGFFELACRFINRKYIEKNGYEDEYGRLQFALDRCNYSNDAIYILRGIEADFGNEYMSVTTTYDLCHIDISEKGLKELVSYRLYTREP